MFGWSKDVAVLIELLNVSQRGAPHGVVIEALGRIGPAAYDAVPHVGTLLAFGRMDVRPWLEWFCLRVSGTWEPLDLDAVSPDRGDDKA